MRQGRRKKRKGKKRPSHRLPANRPAPISLCMIVKDEEQDLPGCLESIRDLVSEIIIVDTGSTDSTVDIATQYNARIYHIPWENHFAKARNYALDQATQPWILYLDADERLHPPYHPIIRKALSSNQADAYYLRIYSKVGKVLGSIPHVQMYPRLFRKIPGVKFEGRIHEQITPSIQRINGRFAYLDVEIEHLGYHLSDEELHAKIRRNLNYLKQQVEEEPDNPYAWYQYGQTLILAKEKEQGISHLQRVIEMTDTGAPLAVAAQMIIANEFFLQEDYTRTIELLQPALTHAPRQRLGWFLLSESYASLQQYPKAIDALHKVIHYKKLSVTDINMDKDFDDSFINQRLGLYYFSIREYRQAVRFWNTYFSDASSLRSNLLGKFLMAIHTTSDSLNQFDKILNTLINRLDVFDNIKDAIEVLGSFFETHRCLGYQAKLFRRASELFPEEAIYPYYLGNAFLGLGRFVDAEEQYRKALQLDDAIYETYYNLAVTAIKQRKYPEAIQWFLQIREKFPEHAEMANRRLAGLYMKIGDMDSAREFANKLLTEHPSTMQLE